MRKLKLDGDIILLKDAISMPWPENHCLKGLRKKSKVIAVKIIDQVIVDYKRCVVPSEPKIFTVEYVTEETFKLFQIGTYESPIVFRMNGYSSNSLGTTAYRNWDNYRIVELKNV